MKAESGQNIASLLFNFYRWCSVKQPIINFFITNNLYNG